MATRTENSYRLKSSVLLRGLDFISRILLLKPFGPLHEAIRVAQTHLTKPWLKRRLAREFRSLRDVHLRHSQTKSGDYHFLLSDVDLTLVISDDAPEAEVERLAKRIERIRSVTLFLGEVEIYRESEFASKIAIEHAIPEVIELLRLVRKFSWVEIDERRPYHRLKAIRSHRKTEIAFLKVLESPAIKNVVIEAQTELLRPPTDRARVAALAEFLGVRPPKMDGAVYALIYAIAPTNSFGAADSENDLLFPELRAWVCRHESIQTLGRARMLLGFPNGEPESLLLRKWAAELESYSKKTSERLAIDNAT